MQSEKFKMQNAKKYLVFLLNFAFYTFHFALFNTI